MGDVHQVKQEMIYVNINAVLIIYLIWSLKTHL